jgi:hypothetical protein
MHGTERDKFIIKSVGELPAAQGDKLKKILNDSLNKEKERVRNEGMASVESQVFELDSIDELIDADSKQYKSNKKELTKLGLNLESLRKIDT